MYARPRPLSQKETKIIFHTKTHAQYCTVVKFGFAILCHFSDCCFEFVQMILCSKLINSKTNYEHMQEQDRIFKEYMSVPSFA